MCYTYWGTTQSVQFPANSAMRKKNLLINRSNEFYLISFSWGNSVLSLHAYIGVLFICNKTTTINRYITGDMTNTNSHEQLHSWPSLFSAFLKFPLYTKKSIDFAGSTSLSIAVIAIMLLFQMMGNAVINLPLLLTLLVVSFLFFIGFYFAEKRAVDPIVPLELFKNPSFIAKNIMFFMQYGFFGFYTNYLPTWGQGVMGATALVGGMVLIPSAIMLVIGTRNVNHLIQKVGEKKTIYIGFSIMVLGAIFLFSLPEHASIVMLFVATAILGTAFGIVNITLQVAVQESVAKHLIGAATAVNALLRTMGTTLVLSGLSIALNRTFTEATAHNPKLTTTLLNQISDAKALKNIPVNLIAPLRHTLFNGMHLLALISGLLLFIALFVNWLDPWKKGLE